MSSSDGKTSPIRLFTQDKEVFTLPLYEVLPLGTDISMFNRHIFITVDDILHHFNAFGKTRGKEAEILRLCLLKQLNYDTFFANDDTFLPRLNVLKLLREIQKQQKKKINFTQYRTRYVCLGQKVVNNIIPPESVCDPMSVITSTEEISNFKDITTITKKRKGRPKKIKRTYGGRCNKATIERTIPVRSIVGCSKEAHELSDLTGVNLIEIAEISNSAKVVGPNELYAALCLIAKASQFRVKVVDPKLSCLLVSSENNVKEEDIHNYVYCSEFGNDNVSKKKIGKDEDPLYVLIPIVIETDLSNRDLLCSSKQWILGIFDTKHNHIRVYDPLQNYVLSQSSKILFHKICSSLIRKKKDNPRVCIVSSRCYNRTKDDNSSSLFIMLYAELFLFRSTLKADILLFRMFITDFDIDSHRKRWKLLLSNIANNHNLEFFEHHQQSFSKNNSAITLDQCADRRTSNRLKARNKISEMENDRIKGTRGMNFADNVMLSSFLPPLTQPSKMCHNRTHPEVGCASISLNHAIQRHESGGFGDVIVDTTGNVLSNNDGTLKRKMCGFCSADLLESEYQQHRCGKFNKCCGNNKYDLRKEFIKRQMTPSVLLHLIAKDDHYLAGQIKRFKKNIIRYNDILSFGTISLTGDRPPPPVLGEAPILLNGTAKYVLSGLYPPVDKSGKSRVPLRAQVYILDPEDAISARKEGYESLTGTVEGTRWINEQILSALDKMLRENNPLASLYKKTHEIYQEKMAAFKIRKEKAEKEGKDIPNEPRLRMILLTNREANNEVNKQYDKAQNVHPHRTEHPEVANVGMIWVDELGAGEPPNYKGAYICGRDGETREVPYMDPQIDAITFPLICPYGQDGFKFGVKMNDASLESVHMKDSIIDEDSDLSDVGSTSTHEAVANLPRNAAARKKRAFVSPRQWARFMLMTRRISALVQTSESALDRENLKRIFADYPEKYHHIMSKGKLAEAYILHTSTRIERHEIDEIKKAQTKFRKILRGDLNDAIKHNLLKKHPGAKLGKTLLDPVTAKGSRRYMQKAYANAMSIIQHRGNPFRFVTFTGNPRWKEITEALDKGESWLNRPDIVCRIFIDKANAFVKDLTERQVLGKLHGWIISLEHQKRGMPHLHCLLIPDPNTAGLGTADLVNDYISAEIPASTTSQQRLQNPTAAEQQERLRELVIQHNLHICSESSMCLFNGKCSKRFLKPFSEHTIVQDNGYTLLRRRRPKPGFDETSNCSPAPVELSDTSSDSCKNYNDSEVLSLDASNIADNLEGDLQCEIIKNECTREGIPEEAMPEDKQEVYGSTCTKIFGNVKHVIDNRYVVAYNPWLTLKYETHINVEDCFGQKCVNYVLKYIVKGHDCAWVALQSAAGDKDVYDYDEFNVRLQRFVTACEAFMKIWSYPIVQLSHTVEDLYVHAPDDVPLYFNQGDEFELVANPPDPAHDKSKLLGFFQLNKNRRKTYLSCIERANNKEELELCAELEEHKPLLYADVNKDHWYDLPCGVWRKRKTGLSKKSKNKRLSRITSVNAKKPELMAIRTLLMFVEGPTEFDDLKRVDISRPNEVAFGEEPCDTFTDACRLRGLYEDTNMWLETFLDAAREFTSAKRFRYFFAMTLFHSSPGNNKFYFEKLFDQLMWRPIGHESDLQRNCRKQKILNHLEYIFHQLNTCCKDMGLDEPENYNEAEIEEEAEQEAYLTHVADDPDAPKKIDWSYIVKKNIKLMENNVNQKEAFTKITTAIDKPVLNENDFVDRMFFVEGAGGTGKTFLYNSLVAHCKSKNTDCIVSASTGIAATLLLGGKTVHSAFLIPLEINSESAVSFDYQSRFAERIRSAKVIIIDEVSMLHRNVLEHVDKTIRSVVPDQFKGFPFGGKVLILGGDWKQLMPIVPGKGIREQFAASIKNWEYYVNMKTLRLRQNMRVKKDQIIFAKELEEIGNGLNYVDDTPYIKARKETLVKDLDELIAIYPKAALKSPLDNVEAFRHIAILCPTNLDVHKINEKILKKLPGKITEHRSINKVNLEYRHDALAIDAAANLPENIETLTPSGMPPHTLRLKVGAVVMLIKNLDVSNGLVNGTRLQVLAAGNNILKCQILTGSRKGHVICLPKIRFEYGKTSQEQGVKWTRLQFPVRLSFAMTINKAQGQSLDQVGIFLQNQQVFAHGQLYVALSRCTTFKGVHILNGNISRMMNNQLCNFNDLLLNIVYKKILDDTGTFKTDQPLILPAVDPVIRILDERVRQASTKSQKAFWEKMRAKRIPFHQPNSSLPPPDLMSAWTQSQKQLSFNSAWYAFGRELFDACKPMTIFHLQQINQDFKDYPNVLLEYELCDLPAWVFFRRKHHMPLMEEDYLLFGEKAGDYMQRFGIIPEYSFEELLPRQSDTQSTFDAEAAERDFEWPFVEEVNESVSRKTSENGSSDDSSIAKEIEQSNTTIHSLPLSNRSSIKRKGNEADDPSIVKRKTHDDTKFSLYSSFLLLNTSAEDCCINSALQILRLLSDVKALLKDFAMLSDYFENLMCEDSRQENNMTYKHSFLNAVGHILICEGDKVPIKTRHLRQLKGFPVGEGQQDAEEILSHIIRSYPPINTLFAYQSIQTLNSFCKCVKERQSVIDEISVQIPITEDALDFTNAIENLQDEFYVEYKCDICERGKTTNKGAWQKRQFDVSSTKHLLVKLNVFSSEAIISPSGTVEAIIKRMHPFVTNINPDRQNIFGHEFRLTAIIWQSGETPASGHYKVIGRDLMNNDFYVFEDALTPIMCNDYVNNGLCNAYVLIFSKISNNSVNQIETDEKSNIPPLKIIDQPHAQFAKPDDMPDLPIELRSLNIDDFLLSFRGTRFGNEYSINGYSNRLFLSDLQRLSNLSETTNAWLNDNILDAYLTLLTSRFQNFGHFGYFHPQSYLRRLARDHIARVDVQSWRWNNTSTVFAVGRIHNNHFVVVAADLQAKTIRVIDPLWDGQYDHERTDFMITIRDMLNIVHKEQSNFTVMPMTWEVIDQTVMPVPLQHNAADCGVFCLIYVYYICSSQQMTFDHLHMAYFRRKICYELLYKRLLEDPQPSMLTAMCVIDPDVAFGRSSYVSQNKGCDLAKTLLSLFEPPYVAETAVIRKMLLEKVLTSKVLNNDEVIIMGWALGFLSAASSVQLILENIHNRNPFEFLSSQQYNALEELASKYGYASIVVLGWKWCLISVDSTQFSHGVPAKLTFLEQFQRPTSPLNPEVLSSYLTLAKLCRQKVSILCVVKILTSLM